MQAVVNKFSNMFPWEKSAVLGAHIKKPAGGRRMALESLPSGGNYSLATPRSLAGLPNVPDWSSIFPTVKDQGSCGDCWAFATAALVEAAYYISTGSYVSLSEKDLLDCDTADSGCGGGWYTNSLPFAQSKGLVLESDYPYFSTQSACPSGLPAPTATLSGWTQLAANDEQGTMLQVNHHTAARGWLKVHPWLLLS